MENAFKFHDNLNPALWDENNSLKDDVREKILEIVDAFKEYCDIRFETLDIQLVGSSASYNWTDKSDLDIHIITNFSMINEAEELVKLVFDLEKSSFNKKHDITIKGVNAEVYVEDVNAGIVSNGIYSVLNNEWIKKPKKLNDVIQKDFSELINKWEPRIKEATESNNREEIKQLLNSIYLIRKNSLAIDGEYGYGNQLFKQLRNAGYLDLLKQAFDNAESKQLSLEGLNN